MEKLQYNTEIKAPKQKVWDVLLGAETYPQWTKVFAEGSTVETDWQEGSKALFLDGKGSGLAGKIETHRPNDYICIRHLGMVKDGKEDYTSAEVQQWAGAAEEYRVTENDGATTLLVQMDSTSEFADYFNKTWPLALQSVKELAEGK